MIDLDQLDKRILFELDRNSRQSVSTLARKVRQGRDRVEYRMRRLFDRGIILKCAVEVDLYKLGFTHFKTYLRLENSKQRVTEFVNYLSTHPRIYWVARCDGGWDMIMILQASSAREFYDIHSAILSKFNDVVLNFTTYTIVEYKIHTRNYLQAHPRSHNRFGGMPISSQVDEDDHKILSLLATDARMPTTEIAARVKMSSALTAYRITRLEKLGIIVCYRLDLNLPALGLEMFKAQFFLRNYDLELRQQFIEYCNHHPNVTYYIEQVGDCNIEIEMEVSGYSEYARIIEEIRGEYSKLIRNFTTVIVRSTKHFPMPKELPKLNLRT